MHKSLILAAVAALGLAGCSEYSQSDRTLAGGLIGAGTGAAVGSAVSGGNPGSTIAGGNVSGDIQDAAEGAQIIAHDNVIKRMTKAWPTARLIHLPVHASWLNQAEVFFSILQRKVLTPNDFASSAVRGWGRSSRNWTR